MIFAPLHQGDRIAVVAPSSPFETEPFQKACELLQEAGLIVSPGRHVFNRKRYLAGSEVERAADLLDAFTDPTVSAVFCARGGYGSNRLLPWLPFSSVVRHPKMFLGHSDVTFLHCAFLIRLGWTTFHGPNLIDLALQPLRWQKTKEALFGETPFSWALEETQVVQPGIARGEMVGGNLTCLVHLLGTSFFPDLNEKLLLIEDCNEALYRIDRMLTQLKLARVLDGIAGMVLGRFKNCGDPSALRTLVQEVLDKPLLPVVADLPFGHNEENDVIPLGTPFLLNTYEKRLQVVNSPIAPAVHRPS